jgi:hypothetical protein
VVIWPFGRALQQEQLVETRVRQARGDHPFQVGGQKLLGDHVIGLDDFSGGKGGQIRAKWASQFLILFIQVRSLRPSKPPTSAHGSHSWDHVIGFHYISGGKN